MFWNIRSHGPETQSIMSTIGLFVSAFLSHVVPSRVICCSENSLRAHRHLGFSSNALVFCPNFYSFGQSQHPYMLEKDVDVNLLRQRFSGADVVGYIGRNAEVKNIEMLIEVFSMIKRSECSKPVKFLVIGRGFESPEKSIIADHLARWNLGLNDIVFMGLRQDRLQFISLMNVLLLTSRTEGFPNVLVEGVDGGAICLSTDAGAALDILDEDFVVDVDDSPLMAEKVENILQLSLKDRQLVHQRQLRRVRQYFDIKSGSSYIQQVYDVSTGS